jgi:hypothetical protein
MIPGTSTGEECGKGMPPHPPGRWSRAGYFFTIFSCVFATSISAAEP